MRVTDRSIELLQLLAAARWLTTSQIRRRFFPGATLDAARRWLRKHSAKGYLVMMQPNRMAEALFTLGREGKRVLESLGTHTDITLERRLPKQIEHMNGINEFR